MRNKLSLHILKALAAIYILAAIPEPVAFSYDRDSIVTNNPDGSVTVTYVSTAIDAVPNPNYNPGTSIQPKPTLAQVQSPALNETRPFTRPESSYDIGAIPIQASVSPTGARVYNIPIETGPGGALSPQISLSYNSQAGDGLAGYGWSISGISCISVRNRGMYYDGKNEATLKDLNPEYALDGIPLVKSELLDYYDYSTVSGNIQVKKNPKGNRMDMFTVYYPNGTIAKYGSLYYSPAYPVTEITDINGNRISFEYDEYGSGEDICINNITYGKNCKISFVYQTRDPGPEYKLDRYSHGVNLQKRKVILKEIRITNNDEVLYRYTLAHEQKDKHEFVYGTTLLKSVSLTNGKKSFPPVTFTYGDDLTTGQLTNVFTLKDSQQLPVAFPMKGEEVTDDSFLEKLYHLTLQAKYIVKRGKIIPGSTSDCIVVYPEKETYTEIAKRRHGNIFSSYDRKYGSEYSADQKIYCFSGIFSNLNTATILAGEGFQGLEMLDVDGDGTDEIVKINNEGIKNGKNRTRFTITVYSFRKETISGTGNPLTSKSFSFNLDAGIGNKHYDSPVKCWYYYGDFRGDGRNLLLIISREQGESNLQSRFVLVDLDKSEKISEQTIYNVHDDAEKVVYSENSMDSHISFTSVADFENDGQSDLFHITSHGVVVYSLDKNDNILKNRATYGGITSGRASILTNVGLYGSYAHSPIQLHILDLNGDGYLDIASLAELHEDDNNYHLSEWHFATFSGERFNSFDDNLTTKDKDDSFEFIDINKDGLPDLIHKLADKWVIMPNLEGYFYYDTRFYSYPTFTTNIGRPFVLVPCDKSAAGYLGDCLVLTSDKIMRYECPVNHETLRRIVSMSDSHGNILENTYKTLTDPDGPYSIDLERSYNTADGYSRPSIPLSVLSEEKYFSEGRISGHIGYTYTDIIFNKKGIGLYGFGETSVSDYLSGNRIIRKFAPEKLGAMISETLLNKDELISRSTTTYDNHSTICGKLSPRLVKQENQDLIKNVTSISTYEYEYGSFDLPTKVESKIWLSGGDFQTTIQTSKYQNSLSPERYVIGAVAEQSVTTELDGDETSSWRTKSLTEYDGKFRPIRSRSYVGKWYPGNNNSEYGRDSTNIVSETRITYDSHGNVLSKKSSAYGGTEFLGTTYTYDSDGRYLLTETNALGQTTTYSGYNKFGKPETVTDHKGNATRMYYDNWGNCIRTVSPDGEETSTSTAWGGEGLYTVSSTSNAGPRSITHYDALGREIRSGIQRFDGSWLFTDKVYDERGRLYKTSLPFRGNEASLWSITEYDKYGRIVKVSEPAGKETLISYSGTSVTTTKDGIISTSTSDASGNVISVTDAGGTITYSFRDDGQPAAVTAPGNAVTTFTYDRYGRRTSIIDPSAGTRTESYTDKPDGSSVVTSINPNGTIITYSDKYGRTTKVERRGEYNTEYIYDAEGRLSSEVSTNGTSTSYTYDGLDRVVASTESVPDGKWLKTSFEFLANGALGATQYESNEGVITTVSYEYRNGCSVGKSLPDGTYIAKLLAENELGLPTRIQTGGIFRDYEYTATGLPVRRKLDDGRLQNFRYNFDAQTGNLLMRQDILNSQTESFEYDNLNRLTSTGARHFAYDALGNIISMDGVGTMRYNNASRPYQVSSLSPVDGGAGILIERAQTVSYTCYSRPSRINEGGRSAAFTYNGNGDRVKMHVVNGQNVGDNQASVMDRYYIGSTYECDITYKTEEIRNKLVSFKDKTIERLYLDGDAYSAPMVYIRENNGPWTLYNIGRDYLGSITHIATADGDLVAEYSYDPWGRLRNPQTLEIYEPGSEPELFLGRGYTSHEHLSWFGLINMNARLYDPLLGRFLSPDPYVQTPDFTQNFNRYSYALNNPLRYTDPSGNEIFTAAFMFLFNGYSNWFFNGCQTGSKGWKDFFFGVYKGALSYSTSFATTTLLNNTKGIFTGAAVGALVGGSSAALVSFVEGNSKDVTMKNILIGASIGAITGGKEGFLNAKRDNKNIWWGSRIKIGRTKWSFFTFEKPLVNIDFGIPDNSPDEPNNCLVRAIHRINDFFGGKKTYAQIRKEVRYVPDKGVLFENDDKAVSGSESILLYYCDAKDFTLDDETADMERISRLIELRDEHKIIVVHIKVGDKMYHVDLIERVRYYIEKGIVVDLKLKSINLDNLDPNWMKVVSGLKY